MCPSNTSGKSHRHQHDKNETNILPSRTSHTPGHKINRPHSKLKWVCKQTRAPLTTSRSNRSSTTLTSPRLDAPWSFIGGSNHRPALPGGRGKEGQIGGAVFKWAHDWLSTVIYIQICHVIEIINICSYSLRINKQPRCCASTRLNHATPWSGARVDRWFVRGEVVWLLSCRENGGFCRLRSRGFGDIWRLCLFGCVGV